MERLDQVTVVPRLIKRSRKLITLATQTVFYRSRSSHVKAREGEKMTFFARAAPNHIWPGKQRWLHAGIQERVSAPSLLPLFSFSVLPEMLQEKMEWSGKMAAPRFSLRRLTQLSGKLFTSLLSRASLKCTIVLILIRPPFNFRYIESGDRGSRAEQHKRGDYCGEGARLLPMAITVQKHPPRYVWKWPRLRSHDFSSGADRCRTKGKDTGDRKKAAFAWWRRDVRSTKKRLSSLARCLARTLKRSLHHYSAPHEVNSSGAKSSLWMYRLGEELKGGGRMVEVLGRKRKGSWVGVDRLGHGWRLGQGCGGRRSRRQKLVQQWKQRRADWCKIKDNDNRIWMSIHSQNIINLQTVKTSTDIQSLTASPPPPENTNKPKNSTNIHSRTVKTSTCIHLRSKLHKQIYIHRH